GGVGAALTSPLSQAALAYSAVRATRGATSAARALLALRARIEEPHDLVKASVMYDYLPSVSGGDGSLAPLAELDREGRKFLGLATPATAIAELMREPARDPVRVFVGLGTADTPAERVRVAVAELERLGAFERRRLLVACPVGSGYVNPGFVEAEEYMSRGDVATVTVQYNNERSFRSLKSVPRARETYRLLLEALHDRLAADDGRPEVVFYGESLGAWVGAELLAEGGVELAERLGVVRGVLLGIPHGGAYKLVRLRGASARLPEGLGVFGTADELEALPPEERSELRYVIVTHPEDPVANYTGLQLVWRRPFWLRPAARSPRIPAAMRWMPGVTFLQVLFDVKNGTSFVPVFEPHAHDYRAEHPAIVRIAYGHDDVTDEQLGAVAARTLASAERQWERERGRPWR
ncbi:MAG TPA: alpha/beta-hydrolase family protein, partial [Gaiellaceae bacterium]|nr:alpha/beta-hydrolase family protein [Gaiellaceae bacterium]